MTSSSKFLDYEVTLLLAKYGKADVLRALAERLQLGGEQLEALLQSPPVRRSKARSTKLPPLSELLARLMQEHPDKAESLHTLSGRLEGRTFLPELRDLRRFFEQHGCSLGSAKSRAKSLPRVLRMLAELEATELEALCQAPPEDSRSSLGLISDEILRGRG